MFVWHIQLNLNRIDVSRERIQVGSQVKFSSPDLCCWLNVIPVPTVNAGLPDTVQILPIFVIFAKLKGVLIVQRNH